MKKKIIVLTITLLSYGVTYGQSSYFNTISNNKAMQKEKTDTVTDSISVCEPPPILQPSNPVTTIPTVKSFLEGLSVKELEYLVSEYAGKRNDNSKVSHSSPKKKGGAVLRFYEGDSHPLTVSNVMSVMDEVGISNQIIVLAQSLLETGFYTSNVCKTYNNLFGLYDSRKHDYYRFERWEDSVVGYQKFIQYRYKGGNYFSFLKRIGYAEDPKYTGKVYKIASKLTKMEAITD